MCRSVRDVASRGSRDCHSKSLKDFQNDYPAQIALMGIQLVWTAKVQETLQKCSKDRTIVESTKTAIKNMHLELTKLVLEKIDSKLIRTKIETLITIMVHQRDVYIDQLAPQASQHRIRDDNDFE